MKKRILLTLVVIAMLAFAFAVISSAATVPDATKGTVTLSDKTVCPLYDTNGNALIWYKSTANADDGYANYDFIRADNGNGEEGYEGGTVYYNTTWSGSAATNSAFPESKDGITLYEVESFRIVDKNGTTINNNDIVIFNINDDDVKSNEASKNEYLNRPINCVKWIFNNNDSVEYIYFHPCLAALQANAIVGCDNLKYVNFEDLVNLRQIDGGNEKSVGANPKLFLGGTCDLGKTALVKVVGRGAMAENAYSKLILPRTLSSADNYPFEKNPNLTEVVFNSTKTSFGGLNHFYNCTSLTTVKGFGNTNAGLIPEGMFQNCPITSITIPETVESISRNAFASTALTEVVIPNNVTSLGQNAFKGCANLTTVRIGKSVTTFGGYDVFNTCPSLTTIYMPAGISGPDLRNTFYGSPNITTVYFVGTEDELDTFCTLLSKVSDNTNFTNLTRISLAKYEQLENKTGKYIIYDYSVCDAFYGSNHKIEADADNECCGICSVCEKKQMLPESEQVHKNVWIFNGGEDVSFTVAFVASCECKYCGKAEKTENIGAILTTDGYSVENGGTGVYQQTKINKIELNKYTAITGEEFDYGIFAGIAALDEGNPLANSESGIVPTEKTVFASFANTEYTLLQIKVTGLVDGAKIYCGAYIMVGEDIVYLSDKTEAKFAKMYTATIVSE